MVKIIREGKLPGEKVFRHTCSNCTTIFEFKAREAKLLSDPREGDYLQIDCPFCKRALGVAL